MTSTITTPTNRGGCPRCGDHMFTVSMNYDFGPPEFWCSGQDGCGATFREVCDEDGHVAEGNRTYEVW